MNIPVPVPALPSGFLTVTLRAPGAARRLILMVTSMLVGERIRVCLTRIPSPERTTLAPSCKPEPVMRTVTGLPGAALYDRTDGGLLGSRPGV